MLDVGGLSAAAGFLDFVVCVGPREFPPNTGQNLNVPLPASAELRARYTLQPFDISPTLAVPIVAARFSGDLPKPMVPYALLPP
jgi:hypothetical protein